MSECVHAMWEVAAMTYGAEVTRGPVVVDMRCGRCGQVRRFGLFDMDDAPDNGRSEAVTSSPGGTAS